MQNMSKKIIEIIVETDAVGSTIVFATELVVGYATNTRPIIINKAVKNGGRVISPEDNLRPRSCGKLLEPRQSPGSHTTWCTVLRMDVS